MDILDEISKTIIKASTTLSSDKSKALRKAIDMEDNENAKWALTQILENYQVAEKTRFPLCDDTGIPVYIGKTSIPHRRLYLHKSKNTSNSIRIKNWVANSRRIEYFAKC